MRLEAKNVIHTRSGPHTINDYEGKVTHFLDDSLSFIPTLFGSWSQLTSRGATQFSWFFLTSTIWGVFNNGDRIFCTFYSGPFCTFCFGRISILDGFTFFIINGFTINNIIVHFMFVKSARKNFWLPNFKKKF